MSGTGMQALRRVGSQVSTARLQGYPEARANARKCCDLSYLNLKMSSPSFICGPGNAAPLSKRHKRFVCSRGVPGEPLSYYHFRSATHYGAEEHVAHSSRSKPRSAAGPHVPASHRAF